MASYEKIRPMTQKERIELESHENSILPMLREEIALFFGPWISMIIIFILAWALSAWIARTLFDVRIDWDSRFAPSIWVVGVGACTFYIVYYLLKQVRENTRTNRRVSDDLRSRVVEEHLMELVDIKRFQEPEHGGLFYFLHTEEGKVFCVFDYESQDLGVDGANPLKSSFRPCQVLTIVRASMSQIIISQEFSGKQFTLGSPLEFGAKPSRWPETESYCEIPWDKLEAEFAT
ncbi:MAG: hypothetical protein GY820_19180 [Gammaproteobacteria bacterium]|nr:hypothetical protein [Gammaproteobacteria bacterium]